MADHPNSEIIRQKLDQNSSLLPKRSRWACSACHKRKVRCDAVDHGTPCCNCKLDHLECTRPERRKATAMRRATPSSFHKGQPLEHHAVPTPDAGNEVPDDDRRFRPTQRRWSPPARRYRSRTRTEDEVARWLDLMPAQVLEGVRRRLTRRHCSPGWDNGAVDERDKPQSQEQPDKDCYAKISLAINLLQDVISIYDASESAIVKGREQGSEAAYKPQFSTLSTASCSHLDGAICRRKDPPEDRFPVALPNDSYAGRFTDIQTPESIIYMEESNLDLWLQSYSFPDMSFE